MNTTPDPLFKFMTGAALTEDERAQLAEMSREYQRGAEALGRQLAAMVIGTEAGRSVALEAAQGVAHLLAFVEENRGAFEAARADMAAFNDYALRSLALAQTSVGEYFRQMPALQSDLQFVHAAEGAEDLGHIA